MILRTCICRFYLPDGSQNLYFVNDCSTTLFVCFRTRPIFRRFLCVLLLLFLRLQRIFGLADYLSIRDSSLLTNIISLITRKGIIYRFSQFVLSFDRVHVTLFFMVGNKSQLDKYAGHACSFQHKKSGLPNSTIYTPGCHEFFLNL